MVYTRSGASTSNPSSSTNSKTNRKRKNIVSETQLDDLHAAYEGMDHFGNLPTELQLQILSYIPTNELATRCARVCKYWRVLTKEVSLWKYLELNIRPNNVLPCCQLLRCCPMLVGLKLNTCRISSDDLIQPLLKTFIVFQGLKQLTLWGETFNANMFEEIVSACPLIESLKLRSFKSIQSDCFEHIVKLKKLKHLKLGFYCACLETISTGCHNLESFVSTCSIILDVERFCQLRGHKLKELHLPNIKWTDNYIMTLASCCKQLKCLDLGSSDEMSDEGLEALSGLSSLRSLSLELSHKYTSKDGIVLFFSRMNFLEELNLAEKLRIDDETKYIDDEAMAVISKSLHCLKKFAITLPKVTDVGVKHIMQECKSLSYFELWWMSDLKGVFLSDIPSLLPGLKTLRVHSRIDRFLFDSLAEKMPHLQIKTSRYQTLSDLKH